MYIAGQVICKIAITGHHPRIDDVARHLERGARLIPLFAELGNLFTSCSSFFLLGNVVISKKILRTRKIMVMHSNERGEYCPRTLVDRKRKRYINAVDVVVRLHDPTDPSTVTPAPPSSWHPFSSMTHP